MFHDRQEAGKKLAVALKAYAGAPQTIVIALPRGGVVVGYEVARALQLPLDIVCCRKLGAPFNPEFAIGAVTETGERILSESTIRQLHISPAYIEEITKQEKEIAAARLAYFRKGKEARLLKDQQVILVDDGLATGSTMEAAIKTVRKEQAKAICLAIPVAPSDTLHRLAKEVDKVICLLQPPHFYAVGQFYHHFEQTSDQEVYRLLTVD